VIGHVDGEIETSDAAADDQHIGFHFLCHSVIDELCIAFSFGDDPRGYDSYR